MYFIHIMTEYHTIYDATTKHKYITTIDEIIKIIKNNNNNEFYKFISNEKIKISNNIVKKVEFICHRTNKICELNKINSQFGTEIDIRDCTKTKKLILSHDPYDEGDFFEEYIKNYKNNTLVLNIKSERIEPECIEILKKYNIEDYFFLDSTVPMIYLLNNKYNNTNIACRFSELEPIDFFLNISDKIKYVWVDCFNIFPLDFEKYNIIKNKNKKICIVSPELQGQFNKIFEYRHNIIINNIIPDMICCKLYNIIYWI